MTIRSPSPGSATSRPTRASVSWSTAGTRRGRDSPGFAPRGQPASWNRRLAPIEHAAAVSTLRARYPQYGSHRLEGRPIIGISLARITDWGRLNDMED